MRLFKSKNDRAPAGQGPETASTAQQALKQHINKLAKLWSTPLPDLFRKQSIRVGKVKALVGLDSGSHRIKVVQVVSQGGTSQVLGCFTTDRTQSSSEELRQYFTKRGLLKKPLACSIADESVDNHEFRLPKLPVDELNQAVEWELKKTMPATDQVVRDTLVFEKPEGYEVQCVFASRDVVQSLYQEGQKVGLVPKFLETESSALLSCAARLVPNRTLNRMAIVDLGHAAFRLIFIYEGRISFTRSLYFGLANLCGQVAALLEMNEQEVIPWLEKLGKEESDDTNRVLKALEVTLDDLLATLCEEFGRSEFFFREKGLEDVEELYLCGGGACIKPVLGYLERHLAPKRVMLLDPFATLSSLPEGAVAGSGPQWACAFGLALRAAA